MDFQLQKADGLVNYLGQQVELFIGDERVFFGFLEIRGREAQGMLAYKAYDPLYFLAKNPDDYYFNGGFTASQRAEEVLKNVGVVRGKLAPTGITLPASFYKAAAGDQVIIDGLVKTAQGNSKKYWLRFDASEEHFGATIFERKIPPYMWAFQRGVNMTNARYEESLEEHYNVVKLINRETGKTVVRFDKQAVADFGARTRFEEVDKDHAATMEKDAMEMLKEGLKIKSSIGIEGVNDNMVMPIFHVGDVIYVEDGVTLALGPYFIRRVEHTFVSSKRITLVFDVEAAPDLPVAPFDSAEKDATEYTPDGKQIKKETTPTAVKTGKGVSETPKYQVEMEQVSMKLQRLDKESGMT
ncbi:hypothetical protein L3i20_v236820 [Paenibacillus sp. L3-i20]|nr:hypothetical protein L3i20_v236820 [Paenibacillus sp. L3-i20]